MHRIHYNNDANTDYQTKQDPNSGPYPERLSGTKLGKV
jgi:hypothetical protein